MVYRTDRQALSTARFCRTGQLATADTWFRTCRTSSFCTVVWQWQDFNWHDASRSPSAIAELLVMISTHGISLLIRLLYFAQNAAGQTWQIKTKKNQIHHTHTCTHRHPKLQTHPYTNIQIQPWKRLKTMSDKDMITCNTMQLYVTFYCTTHWRCLCMSWCVC